MNLTGKQEAFCKAIVEGLSQYDAYLRAYGVKTMSRRAIDREASLMRSTPKITKRIAELAQLVDEQFAIKTSELLLEAARLAFSDVSKIIDPKTGAVKLPHELDADTRRAVASFEVDDMGRIKYKFWDKNSAQDRLFKHKGMFEKDNKQKAAPVADLLASLTGNVFRPAAEAAQPGATDDDDA